MQIIYTIPIAPFPWKRAGLSGKRFYDRQSQEKLAIGLYFMQQHGNNPKFKGPLKFELISYMTLTKGKKPGDWCDSCGDFDNYAKLMADAINDCKIIWDDDRKVAHGSSLKIYDTNPRSVITIAELL